MNVRFAFAVSNSNSFEKKHFGDADKYLIFESNQDRLVLVEELVNTFQNFEENTHGLQKKGVLISNYLLQSGVNVIVSQQFGRNVTEVSKYFIPIVVYFETIDTVVNALNEKIRWINEEMARKSERYKLFKIKSGILKIDVDECE